jgi:hypothetical protein
MTITSCPRSVGRTSLHHHDPGELYYVIEGEFAFYTGGFGAPVQRIRRARVKLFHSRVVLRILSAMNRTRTRSRW